MMLIVETFFSDWLLKEMNARTWSQADLARAAGLSRTAVSNVLSQQRQPGPEFCVAIAQAFGYPPEVIFRAAGDPADDSLAGGRHRFDCLVDPR